MFIHAGQEIDQWALHVALALAILLGMEDCGLVGWLVGCILISIC